MPTGFDRGEGSLAEAAQAHTSHKVTRDPGQQNVSRRTTASSMQVQCAPLQISESAARTRTASRPEGHSVAEILNNRGRKCNPPTEIPCRRTRRQALPAIQGKDRLRAPHRKHALELSTRGAQQNRANHSAMRSALPILLPSPAWLTPPSQRSPKDRWHTMTTTCETTPTG